MVSLWVDSWAPRDIETSQLVRREYPSLLLLTLMNKRLTFVVGASTGLDEGLSVTGRLLGVFVIGRLVGLSVVGLRLGR